MGLSSAFDRLNVDLSENNHISPKSGFLEMFVLMLLTAIIIFKSRLKTSCGSHVPTVENLQMEHTKDARLCQASLVKG